MKSYSSNKTLLSIAFLILSTSSLPVFSHAIMVKSQPEENATLTVSPKQIDVWFNDKVGGEYKALAVIDSTGNRVDNKDVQQELLDPSHLYCTIPTLPAGTYTIRYRVVSIDTHIVTGKFQFTIKTP
jgi:methionine-rich copper-binding protein CopC